MFGLRSRAHRHASSDSEDASTDDIATGSSSSSGVFVNDITAHEFNSRADDSPPAKEEAPSLTCEDGTNLLGLLVLVIIVIATALHIQCVSHAILS